MIGNSNSVPLSVMNYSFLYEGQQFHCFGKLSVVLYAEVYYVDLICLLITVNHGLQVNPHSNYLYLQ